MKKIIKVQFISRDFPEKGSGGSSVYRLSLLKYLLQIGCELEYLLIHYLGEDITKTHQDIRIFQNEIKVIDRKLNSKSHSSIWSSLPSSEESLFVYKHVSRFKPELIIIDHPWLSGIIDYNDGIKATITNDVQFKKVIDFKNMGINPYKRNKNFTIPLWTKQMEIESLSKTDIILAIQNKDLEMFKKLLPAKQVELLPMAYETKMLIDTDQISGRCLFVGGGAQHNVVGLIWFLNEVWPIVKSKNKKALLHICGDVCKDANLKKYEKDISIVFKGRIDNLEIEYKEAQICVIPLIVGSGLKIKLVEAMSYGKACVSTSIGIQGIEEVKNYGVIVGDDKYKFAQAISLILSNHRLRKDNEQMNIQYIKSHLNPDIAYGRFILKILKRINSKF